MNFIRISEAVEITGLNRQTIRNWIDKGIIPAQKINDTFYVDKDTFEALYATMCDVEATRERLESLREDYRRDIDNYRQMQEIARLERNTNRYLSICVNSGIRMMFFQNMVSLMQSLNILTESEGKILTEILDGASFEDLCVKYNISRERVRQMAEKAIRKSRNLIPIEDIHKQSEQKDEEIESLRNEISVLKKMVYKQVVNETETELTEDERNLSRMDRNSLYNLLSQKLYDCDISVRALNILTMYRDKDGKKPIRTVGDLCRISEHDYLSQRNAGKKTLNELTEFLNKKGLKWCMNIDKILMLNR